MSGTLSTRVYTPPAPGSFDPYTVGITGNIPLFFSYRDGTSGGVIPAQTTTTTTAGGFGPSDGGDTRRAPAQFVPTPPGVQVLGGPVGGYYVQNPNEVPFSPSTGSLRQDISNIMETPGLAGTMLSLLSGPSAIPSIIAGTALSQFSSSPRVTGIVGALGDLLADAARTPEERAARAEVSKDFDAMAKRDMEARMGITREDLPAPTISLNELSNIAALSEPVAPDAISVPGLEADIGAFGLESDVTPGAPPSAPAAPSEPAAPAATATAAPAAPAAVDAQAISAALGSLAQNAAALDAMLSDPTAIGGLFGIPGEISGVFGANIDGSSAMGGGFTGSMADAVAAAEAANVDADAGPGGVNEGGSPGGSEGGNPGSGGDASQGGSAGEASSDGAGGMGWKKGGLVTFAQGGVVQLEGGGKVAIGPGGGLDDLIPTSINGRRAAALSDGEFVIPADVVSMMGDGSSNAGARRLYDLVKQIRQEKTGTTRQAGPLPVGQILKRSIGR
jgi:hypothetical protein